MNQIYTQTTCDNKNLEENFIIYSVFKNLKVNHEFIKSINFIKNNFTKFFYIYK